MRYVVQAGDTLFLIAKRFGTTINAIVRANNLTNPDVLSVGQVLIIPTGGTTPVPTPKPKPGPAPIPAPAPHKAVCPELRKGSRGAAVTRLQNLLQSQGFNPGPIDGIFGVRTENAVKALQSQKGLSVTGVVTVQVWVALGENCSSVVPAPQPPPHHPPAHHPAPHHPPCDSCHEHHCPVLRMGSKGSAVRHLQHLLKELGHYLADEDGDFRERTEHAVRLFRRQHNLSDSGLVDDSCWQALGMHCKTEPKLPEDCPMCTKVEKGLRHVCYSRKKRFRRGEKIIIIIMRTNIIDDDYKWCFKDGQIIEIYITDVRGKEIWRLSKHRRHDGRSKEITIYPKGTHFISEDWDQMDDDGNEVSSGHYTVNYHNMDTDVSDSFPIDID